MADAWIGNRAALAAELGLSPTNDDSLLIGAAWARWHVGALDRIEGDFAFALWDAPRGELILARDAIGQRPLHFTTHDGAVGFASAPLALAHWRGSVVANLDRLAEFLAHLPEEGPASFVEGVSRVMPGHIVTIGSDRQPRQHRWWTPSLTPLSLSFEEATAAVRTELDRAVLGAIDDVQGPLAAQLSGGLDSALVCSTLVRLRPDASLIAVTGEPGGPVDPVPPGYFDDETRRASENAAAIGGIDHHVASAPPQSTLDVAARDARFVERPTLSACNSNWIGASIERARSLGARVLLEGLLGNFTVSWVGMDRLGELLGKGQWVELARAIAASRAEHGGSVVGLLRVSIGELFPVLSATDPFREKFLRSNHPRVRALVPRARRLNRPRLSSARTRLDFLRYFDPGLIQHSARTEFGVEHRDPLAARRVVELCLRLPTSHFYHGKNRRLVRALLRGSIPDNLLDDKRRGYQGSDWRASAELAIPVMLDRVDAAASDARLAALFDLPRLRRAIEQWPKDGWTDPGQVARYRYGVVRVVCALQWVALVEQDAVPAMVQAA